MRNALILVSSGLLAACATITTPPQKTLNVISDVTADCTMEDKAGKRDLEGAIAEYSSVIDMKGAPADVIAMALLNRALAYSRAHDDDRAGEDLDRVLKMDGASKQVINAAHEKLHRMKRRVSKES